MVGDGVWSPEPPCLSRAPSGEMLKPLITESRLIAFQAGMRENFGSAAKLHLHRYSLFSRFLLSRKVLPNQSYNGRYIGVSVRYSSAMGGRKLPEMRFMPLSGICVLKVAIS